MTFTPIRAAATAILGTVLGGGLACTAILNPRDDVDRCSNTDDCPSMSDRRYVYECRFDPESTDELDSLAVEKVCVPTFARLGCMPPPNSEDPYTRTLELRARSMYYKGCRDTPGVQGCAPGPDGCNEGLTPRADGICDDDDPNTPPAIGYSMSLFEGPDFWGQDVRDQFCRNYFCDDSFVCDTRDNQCRPCDPNRPFGEGGCGEIYSDGKPMCTYHRGSEIESECRGNKAQVGDPVFGDCTNENPGDDDTTTDDPTDPTEEPSDDDGTTGGEEDTTGDTGETDESGSTGDKDTE